MKQTQPRDSLSSPNYETVATYDAYALTTDKADSWSFFGCKGTFLDRHTEETPFVLVGEKLIDMEIKWLTRMDK